MQFSKEDVVYVIVMSRTSFRVNLRSIVLPECQGTPWSKHPIHVPR